MDLLILAAKHALRMLDTDDLPSVAADVLEAGIESPSLLCLAGAPRCETPDDRRALFEAGLRELGIATPSSLTLRTWSNSTSRARWQADEPTQCKA